MATHAETWWLYLLACKDGRMYAGVAIDVAARFDLHASGKGAKFTRANPPRKILAAQAFASRSEAQKAEYALKQLDRAAKLEWVRQWTIKETASTNSDGQEPECSEAHGCARAAPSPA